MNWRTSARYTPCQWCWERDSKKFGPSKPKEIGGKPYLTGFKKASKSDQGDKAEPPTPSQAAVDQELESMPKRQITLTRKALQNAIDTKCREADIRCNKLQGLIHSLEQSGDYEENMP